MKPMLKTRNQQGFTLVEVIVVAVIVAILAGVSVPLYLGYINNSRLNSATNAAGSAASFVNACRNGGNTAQANAAALPAGPAPLGAPTTLLCVENGATLAIPADIVLSVNGNSFTAAHVSNPAGVSTAFAFSP
jgi:type IV pilus assembly protein PilA